MRTDTGILDKKGHHILSGNRVKVELKNGMIYMGYVIPKPLQSENQKEQFYITDDENIATIEIPTEKEGTIEVVEY